ncbi:hypothetical protein JCM13304A_04140 [Desulfothermus okinawensis JCM 13304]
MHLKKIVVIQMIFAAGIFIYKKEIFYLKIEVTKTMEEVENVQSMRNMRKKDKGWEPHKPCTQ